MWRAFVMGAEHVAVFEHGERTCSHVAHESHGDVEQAVVRAHCDSPWLLLQLDLLDLPCRNTKVTLVVALALA